MNLESLRVHQQYRQYTLKELADLVLKTVEQPDENLDPAWRQWFINYCLDGRRPPQARRVTPKAWGRWLALVLRYIQPLATNAPPLETRPFIEVLHYRPDVIKTLMFGHPDAMRLALQRAYDLSVTEQTRLDVPELSSEEQRRFESVRKEIERASERTLTGWSRYYLDKGETIAKDIYDVFHPSSAAALLGIFKLMEQPRQQQSLSGAKFDAYLTRTLYRKTAAGFVGQALAYLNEFERRTNTLLTYSRLFRRSALLLLLFFVSGGITAKLPVGIVGNLVAAICLGLGVLDLLLIGLLIPVMFFYASESYTWTNTSLKTLEMLMGPLDGSQTELERNDPVSTPDHQPTVDSVH